MIAIDRVQERLDMAVQGKAKVINFEKEKVYDRLMEMTKGRGPDRCIEAVGAEAHSGGTMDAVLDNIKGTVGLPTDRMYALQEAIFCCRKGGTVSIPGVYFNAADKVPLGAMMNKALTLTSGQTHVQHYTKLLLSKIEAGDIDPSFVITHRLPLKDGPTAYKTFRDKADGCIKVVLKP